MKRIELFAVLAGLLLTGCNKSSNSDIDNLTASAGKGTVAAPAMIYYKLAATPRMQDQQMQWNSGYLTIGSLVFTGTHVNGNMLSAENFSANVNKTVKLYESTDLGAVAAQPDLFNYGQFGLQLNPLNDLYTFYLAGTYNLDGTGIPVRVMITEQQLKANANWNNSLQIAYGKNYLVTLMPNIYNITSGITSDMIANATRSGGSIEISNSSNEDLYKLMVANIQNNMILVTSFTTLPGGVLNGNTNIKTTAPASVQ